MQSIIGKHELSSATKSFFSADGKVKHGGTGRSKLVHAILKDILDAKLDISNITESYIIAVDAMQVIQKLEKDPRVTIFADLRQIFIRRIDTIRATCCVIVVAFNTYQNSSLKGATRKERKGKQVPMQYTVRGNADITGLPLPELFCHENTKRDLSVYFMNGLVQQFESINVTYVVTGIDQTIS